MSSTQLDHFAAAALSGLIARGWSEDAEQLAREAFRIARAMMTERLRQAELPDTDAAVGRPTQSDVVNTTVESLELPLRINRKLASLGIRKVRDLTLTTEKAIRNTGLKDESIDEIRQALHRLGLRLG